MTRLGGALMQPWMCSLLQGMCDDRGRFLDTMHESQQLEDPVHIAQSAQDVPISLFLLTSIKCTVQDANGQRGAG